MSISKQPENMKHLCTGVGVTTRILYYIQAIKPKNWRWQPGEIKYLCFVIIIIHRESTEKRFSPVTHKFIQKFLKFSTLTSCITVCISPS